MTRIGDRERGGFCLVVGVLLTTSSCGAPVREATVERVPEQIQRQPGKRVIIAKLEDNKVVATASEQVRCRTVQITHTGRITVKSDWADCEKKSFAGETFVLKLSSINCPSGDELRQSADESGSATFDLSNVELTPCAVRDHTATVGIGGVGFGADTASVDLMSSPLFPKWKAVVEAERAKVQQDRAATETQRDQERQNAVGQEEARCRAGDSAACARGLARSATATNVKAVLLDPRSFDGKAVVLRNVIVSGANVTSPLAGFVNDLGDGSDNNKAIWVTLADDTPRAARQTWMNLPTPEAVLTQVTGLVSHGQRGELVLVLISSSGGARLR